MAQPILSLRIRARRHARAHRLFYTFVHLLKYAPFRGLEFRRGRKAFIAAYLRGDNIVLNLGSGARKISGAVNLCTSLINDPDVVGDGYLLPFEDDSFDAVVCENVIEHVPDPERLLSMMARVLKENGKVYFEYPFLQPRHDVSDFTRWTRSGFEYLANRRGFEILDSGTLHGPAFSLFWILKDTIAILISFGAKPIYHILRYVLAWFLSPMLFLDLVMVRLPHSELFASGFWAIASNTKTRVETQAEHAVLASNDAETPLRSTV